MDHLKQQRREHLVSIIWWCVFGLALVALLGYVFWSIFRPLAGTKAELEGQNHVPETQQITYATNPPTSGPHSAQTEEWGIYDRVLSKAKLVHNLEHSGVIIYYKENDPVASSPEFVQKLKDIAERLLRKDPKVILVPNPEIESKIALAAWGWLDTMDEVDEDRIWKFFTDHINQGPERVIR